MSCRVRVHGTASAPWQPDGAESLGPRSGVIDVLEVEVEMDLLGIVGIGPSWREVSGYVLEAAADSSGLASADAASPTSPRGGSGQDAAACRAPGRGVRYRASPCGNGSRPRDCR